MTQAKKTAAALAALAVLDAAPRGGELPAKTLRRVRKALRRLGGQ